MNEPTETQVTDIYANERMQSAQVAAPLAPTAGDLLRQARERAGLHLGTLSVALKVPVAQLMALESDDHAQLLGPVFVRALAGSVCRQLKIETAPVLALLPQAPHRMSVMPPSLEMPRPDFGGRYWGRRLAVNPKSMLLALLMLALIALVAWLPEWPTTVALVDEPPPQVVVTEPIATSAPMVVLLPSEATMDQAPGNVVPAVKSVVPATSLAAPTLPAVVPAVEVVFKGRSDEAWVEVQDRTGTVVFSKLVKAGETHVLKAVPVLTVVVGAADAVQVQVRGQTLDLTPFSRGAVARFEVK